MRDRLIELTKASLLRHIDKSCKLAENIADDLLAEGVIVPPVKEGTEVYAVTYNPYTFTHTIRRGYVACIDIRSTGEYTIIRHQGLDDEPYFDKIVGRFDDYGKTIFLTKEQAEKTLAEVTK